MTAKIYFLSDVMQERARDCRWAADALNRSGDFVGADSMLSRSRELETASGFARRGVAKIAEMLQKGRA